MKFQLKEFIVLATSYKTYEKALLSRWNSNDQSNWLEQPISFYSVQFIPIILCCLYSYIFVTVWFITICILYRSRTNELWLLPNRKNKSTFRKIGLHWNSCNQLKVKITYYFLQWYVHTYYVSLCEHMSCNIHQNK